MNIAWIGRSRAVGVLEAHLRSEAMALHVVRHACAGSKGDWPGDDASRPLDTTGLVQAHELGRLLAHRPVRRILASGAVRRIETVAPLAGQLQLRVETTTDLEVTPRRPHVPALATNRDYDETVMCTHAEVMRELLNWLRTQRPRVAVTAADTSSSALLRKGTAWALERDQTGRLLLTHVAPDPPLDCRIHS